MKGVFSLYLTYSCPNLFTSSGSSLFFIQSETAATRSVDRMNAVVNDPKYSPTPIMNSPYPRSMGLRVYL